MEPFKTARVEVKSAFASKINWTNVVGIASSLATIFLGKDYDLSPEMQVAIVGVVTSVQSALTIYFRTYSNASVTPQSLPQ